ncbi:MAG: sigma-70 family RNA polymerase sigma factor [Chloroflexi bacterium]|nr:sigma-70 family RNA polymerase sigma factor [Chloroflexota bacterium]
MDEHQAVRLCRGGDRDAFRYLVERHKDVLFGTAYLMTGDRALSEDLVQEAFLSAWKGLRDFRDGRPLKPWLVRILVNKAVSHRRRSRPETTFDVQSASNEADSPVDATEQMDNRATVQRALAALSEEQRQTVMLHYFADLSTAEIGSVLRCEETTVRTRLHRALGNLRQAMGSHPGREM